MEAHEFAKGIDILIHGQEHLQADKDENDTEAVFEIFEILGNGSKCKIEGTEAEYGEDVAREHNERVAADTEDGGDAVNGKRHVGGLDDKQGDGQRRNGRRASCLSRGKFVGTSAR